MTNVKDLISRLKGFVKFRILAAKESACSSYRQHNSEYERSDALEKHRLTYATYEEENLFDNPENRFGELLAAHPEVRQTVVDIGAGAGWLSAGLSRDFVRVVAVEPSVAAQELALQLFPTERYGNIEWKQGFAEDVIPTLKFDGPTLFVTGCILSHLPDQIVARICKRINGLAPAGSILGFAECWGPESHDFMWHVRTEDWWKQALPDWKLTFHGPPIQDVPGRRKGFHGLKLT